MINLHLSWPAYLASGLCGLIAFQRNIKILSLMIGASLAGILVNPIGLHLFSHIFFTVNSSTPIIYEWRPVWRAPVYLFPLLLSFALIWRLRATLN